MSTPSTIKDQLNSLIVQANNKTGKNASDVTTAVQDLIAGYGVVIEEASINFVNTVSE